jgi:hypothetical protein
MRFTAVRTGERAHYLTCKPLNVIAISCTLTGLTYRNIIQSLPSRPGGRIFLFNSEVPSCDDAFF